MAIGTQSNRIVYAGNGSSFEFAFPYYYMNKSDVVVVLSDLSGMESLQNEGTHYDLTDPSEDGGTVTMLTAPPVGYRLAIYREVQLTQEFEPVEGGALPAAELERSEDHLMMATQQLADGLARALLLPVTSNLSHLQMPNPIPGGVWVWNSTAEEVRFVPIDDASLYSYLPEWPNAVQRSVGYRLQERVSVEDFGGVGLGEDATQYINNMLEPYASKDTQQRLPRGVYSITDTLTLYPGSQLLGSGATKADSNSPTSMPGTVMIWDGPADKPMFQTQDAEFNWNILLKDFTIITRNPIDVLFDIRSCDSFQAKRLIIDGFREKKVRCVFDLHGHANNVRLEQITGYDLPGAAFVRVGDACANHVYDQMFLQRVGLGYWIGDRATDIEDYMTSLITISNSTWEGAETGVWTERTLPDNWTPLEYVGGTCSWNGSAWVPYHLEGSVRYTVHLAPAGGWSAGYRPTKGRVTWLQLEDGGGHAVSIWYEGDTVPSGISGYGNGNYLAGNTYSLVFDLGLKSRSLDIIKVLYSMPTSFQVTKIEWYAVPEVVGKFTKTTLSVTVASGATEMELTDGTGFAIDDMLFIDRLDGVFETNMVAGIEGGTVTLTYPLAYDHEAGAIVKAGTIGVHIGRSSAAYGRCDTVRLERPMFDRIGCAVDAHNIENLILKNPRFVSNMSRGLYLDGAVQNIDFRQPTAISESQNADWKIFEITDRGETWNFNWIAGADKSGSMDPYINDQGDVDGIYIGTFAQTEGDSGLPPGFRGLIMDDTFGIKLEERSSNGIGLRYTVEDEDLLVVAPKAGTGVEKGELFITEKITSNSGIIKSESHIQTTGDVTAGGALYSRYGVVMTTPNGTQQYRVWVDNSGLITATLVT